MITAHTICMYVHVNMYIRLLLPYLHFLRTQLNIHVHQGLQFKTYIRCAKKPLSKYLITYLQTKYVCKGEGGRKYLGKGGSANRPLEH